MNSSSIGEELSAGGVSVKVLGNSGKVRMFSTEAGQNDPNAVVIEMDSLRELDADGNPVGASGQDRHSINTFASQDFTFHPVESNFMMGRNMSVSANKLSFESPVGAVGNISVDTFIMRSQGFVGPDGEEWGVGIGDMKFNVRFPNWRWCGDEGSSCRGGEVGEFLELDIKIKGAAEEVNLVAGTLNTYNLGGDANLTLTSKVMLDGVQGQMPAGFPTLRMQGRSQIFTFRFPKFTSSAEYDPLLTQDWTQDEVQNEEAVVTTTGSSGSGVVVSTTASSTAEQTQDSDLVAGGITVRVQGNSGKFRMFSSTAGQNDDNAVVIEMDSLRELDSDGNAVGASGQEKHSIQTFANQDFTFSPIEPNFRMGVNDSVTASKLSFQSTVGDVGSIAVDTFVMSSTGLVGPEGEEWGVGIGDMKFNIRFPNWKWCGDVDANCNGGQVGEFLELNIKIKGAADAVNLVDGTLNTYNLGGDANLTLTSKVMLDGVQGLMPSSYPALRMQGSSQIFTFRFPKFTTSAEYDPLFRQGCMLVVGMMFLWTAMPSVHRIRCWQ